MSATQHAPPRLPRRAARLRLPVHDEAMRRSRERWGFDLNDPEAPERAKTLVEQQPNDAAVRLLNASVLATRGDVSAAESEARRAVDLDPGSARARTTLATLLVARGERDEGLTEARRALELDPTDATVQYNCGLAEWSAGDRRAARGAFVAAQKILDKTPVDSRPPSWWRWALRRD